MFNHHALSMLVVRRDLRDHATDKKVLNRYDTSSMIIVLQLSSC